MKAKLIVLFFLFKAVTSYSQDKLEREYRIKSSEVPSKAVRFITENFDKMKIKWYGEENLDGKAIEAKGKRDGMLYSIKFDTSGNIQDIESIIRFNDIPETAKVNIEKNLGRRFSKFTIQKTQKQWLGDIDVLSELAKGNEPSGKYSVNYEINLKGTKNGRTDYYEVLADQKGEITRESKIIQRNNHHLIY